MKSNIIIGFFKNQDSYYEALWNKIKHWKDAKRAIAVRFAKYEVPVWHRGHIVYHETRFRAVVTFQTHDGRIVSRQCSAQDWPMYLIEKAEKAPEGFFNVFPVSGSKKTGEPRSYQVCAIGCDCPAFVRGKGLIQRKCKHQLMLALELGITLKSGNHEPKDRRRGVRQISDERFERKFNPPLTFPKNNPTQDEDEVNLNDLAGASLNFSLVKPLPKQPIDEEEVDLNDLAGASINFSLVKPKQKEPPKTYRLRVIKSKAEKYFIFNLDTQKYLDGGGLTKEEVGKKAHQLAQEGHKIDAIFKDQYWILLDNKWVNPKEAKASLGV
ncbi:hypothetical protein [Laspinema olomoucense]|uniref:hypothetical protein n=1 Tax=Laspinema olomoucense TaxID=3231600 RepID=UPI0021BABABD|nr:hypothetical protein [Laspinema sp. D3d]MCT7975186.1 hypothetical protein [Laspinema sp. D3d]